MIKSVDLTNEHKQIIDIPLNCKLYDVDIYISKSWYLIDADRDYIIVERYGYDPKEIYYYGNPNKNQMITLFQEILNLNDCKIMIYQDEYNSGHLYIKNLEASTVKIKMIGKINEYFGFDEDEIILSYLNEVIYSDKIINLDYMNEISLIINDDIIKIPNNANAYELINIKYKNLYIKENQKQINIIRADEFDLRGGYYYIIFQFNYSIEYYIYTLFQEYIKNKIKNN